MKKIEKIEKYLKSLYFGDRWCENVIYKNDNFIIQVNLISKLEEGEEKWNFYSEEDIEHGLLVFTEVERIDYDKNLVLNDEIYEIEVVGEENGKFLFVVYGCHIYDDASSIDVKISVKAKDFMVVDPKNLDYKLIDI